MDTLKAQAPVCPWHVHASHFSKIYYTVTFSGYRRQFSMGQTLTFISIIIFFKVRPIEPSESRQCRAASCFTFNTLSNIHHKRLKPHCGTFLVTVSYILSISLRSHRHIFMELLFKMEVVYSRNFYDVKCQTTDVLKNC